MERRDFLAGIIAAAVAPAFVKTAGLLMPIKPLIEIPQTFAFPEGKWIYDRVGSIYAVSIQLEVRNAQPS